MGIFGHCLYTEGKESVGQTGRLVLGGTCVKNLPMQEAWVPSLGGEDPLE